MRPTATIFSLVSMLMAGSASAGEVAFNCNYQLGSEAEATRRKIGAVVIAIDVTTRTAKIDFGKGWFKTMSLAVDGTDLKETSPPASGDELGFFYFDLAAHSGGFSGGGKNREFFDGCVPTQVTDNASAAPDIPAPSTPTPSPSEETPAPLQIPDQAALPPPGAQALPLKADKSQSDAAEKPAAHPEASVAAELKHEDASPPTAVASSDEPAAPPPAAQNTSKAIDGIGALGNRPPARDTNLAPERKQAAAEAPSTVPAPSLAPALPPVPAQSDHPGNDSAEDNPPSVSATPTLEPKTPSSPEPTPITATHPNPPPVPSAPLSPNAVVAAAPAEPMAEPCRDALNAEARVAKVNFANASTLIDEISWPGLRKIAAIAKTCKSAEIEIGGHTDNFGDPADNKELSHQRAQTVVDFLVKEGVLASNLKAVGYGQERPIASNATMAGRRINRRVEFHVSETKTAN